MVCFIFLFTVFVFTSNPPPRSLPCAAGVQPFIVGINYILSDLIGFGVLLNLAWKVHIKNIKTNKEKILNIGTRLVKNTKYHYYYTSQIEVIYAIN